MTAFLMGVRLLFAAIFVYTALSKVADLARFELVLVQLFGTRPFARARTSSRTAARLIAGYELALAAAVGTGVAEPVGTVLVALTMAVFAVVVFRAWRLHVDCGCFRDRRPSEAASLVRSGILLGLATPGPPPGRRPGPTWGSASSGSAGRWGSPRPPTGSCWSSGTRSAGPTRRSRRRGSCRP